MEPCAVAKVTSQGLISLGLAAATDCQGVRLALLPPLHPLPAAKKSPPLD